MTDALNQFNSMNTRPEGHIIRNRRTAWADPSDIKA